MSTKSDRELVQLAIEARENAYAPYSRFRVGAALATESGQIFQGCNVENASYGLAICAEQSAVVSAVTAGQQHFSTIAIVADPIAPPCGACRQFLAEFDLELRVIGADANDPTRRKTWLVRDLLPDNFSLE